MALVIFHYNRHYVLLEYFPILVEVLLGVFLSTVNKTEIKCVSFFVGE